MGAACDDGVATVVAGRYRLHELLGRGGMGAVWRATDELLGRTVAIKRVRLDGLPHSEAAVARERTMREARIAAALQHPLVVTVFDVVVDRNGEGADEPWLVMEYVPARTLGDLLAERGALPPAEVAAIGAQIAAALAAAHAAGIVHRDVKPDNVLVTGTSVKLTDFGISHAASVPALTVTGVLTGTPAYFAPETARGEGTDARSDVWSLGATLYAAVEGHPPFGAGDGNLLALLTRIGRGAPPPPRRAGPLTGVLRDIVADDPAARPTALQAQHALHELATAPTRPVAPSPGPTPDPAARRRLRRRPAVAAVGLVVAGAAVATALVVGSGASSTPSGPQGAARTTQPAASAPGPLAAEHTADPCSLFDPAVLDGFGTATIEPADGRFSECTAHIAGSGGHVRTVNAELANGPETQRATSGWSPPARRPRVLEARYEGSDCQHRVLVPDGSSVLFTAAGTVSPDDLCATASAVAEAAAARLVDPGIGRRRWPADSVLAAHDACDLLTSEEVGRATGSLTRSWRGFGGFTCQWGLPESPRSNVTIAFSHRPPFDDGGGEPGGFVGAPARTSYKPLRECAVHVQQRVYTDERGRERIEAMEVHVYGDGPAQLRCTYAHELATIAQSRLRR